MADENRRQSLQLTSKWYPRPREKCSGEFYTEKQKLLVNWFRLAKNCTGKPIFEFRVKVLKEIAGKMLPLPAKIRVKQFWELMRKGKFPVEKFVFDDFETLYSYEPHAQEMGYKIPVPPGSAGNRKAEIHVLQITYLNNFELRFSRKNPDLDDENANRSQKFLKCLFSQKFRYSPSDSENQDFARNFVNDRNSIIHIPTIEMNPKFEVAPGIGAWLGIYLAVRETAKYEPVLNFGLIHKLFYSILPKMNLLDYMLILIDEKTRFNDELRESYKSKIQKNEFGMSQTQRNQAKQLLEGLKLKAEIVPDVRKTFVERHVTFIEFTDQCARSFVLPGFKGAPTMQRYYAENRKTLRYPSFPLARCKSGKYELLLPIEQLFIHETGQRFKNHLDFNMRTQFVRGATLPPQEHKKSIEDMLERFDFSNEKHRGTRDFLKSFDISPKLQMIECVGKVLKEPELVNRENKRIALTKDVRGFQEAVLNIVPRGKLAIGLIVLRKDGEEDPCVNVRDLKEFYTLLMDVCIERGLPIEENEKAWKRSIFRCYTNVACFNGPVTFQTAVQKTIHEFDQLPEPEKSEKQLFFLIIHKKSYDTYGRIKYILDTEIGVANQVIDESTVRKAILEAASPGPDQPELGPKAQKSSKTIFYNIASQINTKLGGVNQEIGFCEECEMSAEEKEEREKEPLIMYVGIDVTHPTEGSGIDFSIAGIVASINRGATRYIPAVVAQIEKNPDVRKSQKGWPNLKKSREVTDILEGKFVAILRRFAENNRNRLPDKIVVLRDGVSDSEMLETAYLELESLKNEVRIFRRSREISEDEKEPEYTYIVVQKRHKTRFYRVSEEKEGSEKSQQTGFVNPKSGTVADKTVVSPYKFDFWLTSHHGELGTSRPAHYTVLYDNSRMTKDLVYKMCYELSFLSARCRKPISIPTPIHYAHLVCEKAKNIFKATKKGYAPPEKEREMIEEVLQPNRCYPGMSFV